MVLIKCITRTSYFWAKFMFLVHCVCSNEDALTKLRLFINASNVSFVSCRCMLQQLFPRQHYEFKDGEPYSWSNSRGEFSSLCFTRRIWRAISVFRLRQTYLQPLHLLVAEDDEFRKREPSELDTVDLVSSRIIKVRWQFVSGVDVWVVTEITWVTLYESSGEVTSKVLFSRLEQRDLSSFCDRSFKWKLMNCVRSLVVTTQL